MSKTKTPKLDRAKVITTAMGMKNSTIDQMNKIESLIRSEESLALQKLHKYFSSQHYIYE